MMPRMRQPHRGEGRSRATATRGRHGRWLGMLLVASAIVSGHAMACEADTFPLFGCDAAAGRKFIELCAPSPLDAATGSQRWPGLPEPLFACSGTAALVVALQTLLRRDPKRDTVIVDGAVDQLDHSAVRDLFGGKIGIDATAKGPEDGHPRGWPQEIEMSAEIKALVDQKWVNYEL